MATTTSMVGPNADLDFYFTGVNLAYLRALAGQNRAFYTQIAQVPTAAQIAKGTERIRQADGSTGTRVKFPVRLAASRPRKWPQGQPRPFEQFAAMELQVDLDRYCPPAKRESWVVWSSDIYGLIKEQLPDMMDRSIILWDEVLAEAMAANAPWKPDNLPFFSPQSAQHPANPAKLVIPGGQSAFYNDVPVTGIDVPNMRAVYSLLTTQPGPDGVPLDTDEVEVWVLAPNDDMGFQLKQVFQGAITAEPVGATAAAGVSNSLQGAAKVQVFKVLSSTVAAPTFGGNAQDRGRVGYMIAVPRGEGKPFAVVPSIHPTAYYTGMNGSDHLRASMGEVEFGWDAFGAAVLAIAQRAVRFTINPV